MFFRLLKRLPTKAALSSIAVLALGHVTVQGQYLPSGTYAAPGASTPYYPCPSPAGFGAPTSCGIPYGAMPLDPTQPYYLPMPAHPCLPAPLPQTPGRPAQPGQPTPSAQTPQPSDSTRTPDTSSLPSDTTNATNPFDTFNANAGQGDTEPAGGQGAAGGGGSLAMVAPGGYLDNPVPISTFRLRFDAGFDQNQPDRAEYFYGAWKELSFHPHGIQGNGVFFDPRAIGPGLLPANVNYQVPEAYFEFAFLKRFSAFIQVPYRTIQFNNLQEDYPESEMKRNPADAPARGSKFFPEPADENEGNPQTNFNGFSDLQFGFKGALIATPRQYLTFQLRLYSPTGDPGLGLGTGHWSIEPSLLYYKQLSKRLVVQGQLTEWTPFDGGVAGNLIQYGLGLGYAVYQRGNVVIMPTTEVMGWTVLNGYESVFQPISATAPPGLELPVTHGVVEAGGDTIVNAQWGLRTFFGNGQSLFAGYSRALTGTHWYTDDFRVEYRVFFGRNKAQFRPL